MAFKSFYERNINFFTELKKKIPQEWINNELKKLFSEEMKSKIKNDKNWKEVLKEFEKIFSEQKKKTQWRKQMDWHRRDIYVW